MKQKIFTAGIISLTIVILDQWTKSIVHRSFRLGESISIIEQFFSLTYIRNFGAAFGLFRDFAPSFREPFLLAVPIIATIVIIFMLYRIDQKQKWSLIGLSFILAGAVSNLLNRAQFGYVIDFLDVHWKNVYHWPAFNIADSAIVFGVGIFFVISFTKRKSSEST